ncbi:uncharacterized protein [Henckelia pumila]|uniref:uncharacterized protein n=1 Tax=Henckelia pumila TaxID=405737 RepID=UPI003C6DCA06
MENTWHTFVSCPYATECWTNSNMKDIVDQCAKNADGFVDLFFKVLTVGDKVNVGRFAGVLWSIWKQRNNKLWRDAMDNCNQAVFSALDILYDWLAIKQKGTGGKENNAIARTPTEWRKPQAHFLKCNVDAAFFTKTKIMGFGMVVRDTEGKCVGYRSMIVEGLCEVKEGEAMGLREALSWIRGMKFNRVIFEMDAQIVVKAFGSTKTDESEFGAIIEDCRRIMQHEPSFLLLLLVGEPTGLLMLWQRNPDSMLILVIGRVHQIILVIL